MKMSDNLGNCKKEQNLKIPKDWQESLDEWADFIIIEGESIIERDYKGFHFKSVLSLSDSEQTSKKEIVFYLKEILNFILKEIETLNSFVDKCGIDNRNMSMHYELDAFAEIPLSIKIRLSKQQ